MKFNLLAVAPLLSVQRREFPGLCTEETDSLDSKELGSQPFLRFGWLSHVRMGSFPKLLEVGTVLSSRRQLCSDRTEALEHRYWKNRLLG